MYFVVTSVLLILAYSHFCPILVIVRFSRRHKIQNPALHLFRVTGFSGNRGTFQVLFPSHGWKKSIGWAILPNTAYKELLGKSMKKGFGCWLLDTRYWILLEIDYWLLKIVRLMTKIVSQYPMYVLGAGYGLRVDRNLKLDAWYWVLGFGYWLCVAGCGLGLSPPTMDLFFR